MGFIISDKQVTTFIPMSEIQRITADETLK
jgi:hypothetical protein